MKKIILSFALAASLVGTSGADTKRTPTAAASQVAAVHTEITKTFGFEDSIRAFEFATKPPTGSVKVQIEMPS